ncbi:hypothetical protein L226DRAFT_352433 [Lentinus tigrinus ALCF2SS1-7]|uniref:uncharacterized protein n=1 Tax=Lentinus tigrinus ALCF2SS1-7 TaxID=1328758 RepID=UPI001166068C|nr:hypothetical protein L226DRAFT_352433 [Lentinus tigrinus ALCF2SS1-7]
MRMQGRGVVEDMVERSAIGILWVVAYGTVEVAIEDLGHRGQTGLDECKNRKRQAARGSDGRRVQCQTREVVNVSDLNLRGPFRQMRGRGT